MHVYRSSNNVWVSRIAYCPQKLNVTRLTAKSRSAAIIWAFPVGKQHNSCSMAANNETRAARRTPVTLQQIRRFWGSDIGLVRINNCIPSRTMATTSVDVCIARQLPHICLLFGLRAKTQSREVGRPSALLFNHSPWGCLVSQYRRMSGLVTEHNSSYVTATV